MAVFPQPPSTPPRQVSTTNIVELTRDLVVPAAPRSKRFKNAEYDRIRADCRSEEAPPISSDSANSHGVQSGRVTKPRSILKRSAKSSKQTSTRVNLNDPPRAPKVMEPPTTPPRRPSAAGFCGMNLDVDASHSTLGVMLEPSTPPTPHSCPDPDVKCSRCARIERKSTELASRTKTSFSTATVSEVRGNQFTLVGLKKSEL